jgi:tRNA (guanine37-N1)-methyltransferase
LDKGTIGLGPYELELNYDYWSYPEIMKSILLEEDLEGELPMGFTQSGHVGEFAELPGWLIMTYRV